MRVEHVLQFTRFGIEEADAAALVAGNQLSAVGRVDERTSDGRALGVEEAAADRVHMGRQEDRERLVRAPAGTRPRSSTGLSRSAK